MKAIYKIEKRLLEQGQNLDFDQLCEHGLDIDSAKSSQHYMCALLLRKAIEYKNYERAVIDPCASNGRRRCQGNGRSPPQAVASYRARLPPAGRRR